ncbi:amino acid adenylation domain-containing protein [uncultured Shewanella sp.]|uniref:non-ribosomal peptide synthetase n=1 Tax=uncultured Shewanella sp. TaxID=173975 RepID=UPI00261B54DA|nr:amino acid adenylation domain-containing protein [uncultured Shewanella sp.]
MSSIKNQLQSLSVSEIKALAKKKVANKSKKKDFALKRHHEPRAHYPLTETQKSIWLLSQKKGNHLAYNNPVAVVCRVDTPFLAALSEKAVAHIVKQHAIFSTVFTEVNGEPVQKVSTGKAYRFAYDDFSHGSESEKQTWLKQAAIEEGLRPLDLSQGPLVHFRVIKVNDDRSALLMLFHHIISDGWTVNLFLQAFLDTYDKLNQGLTPTVTDTLQFFDYALYEQAWITSDEYQKGMTFWQDKLANVEGQLLIPTNRIKTSTNNDKGEMYSLKLSASQWEMIQAASKVVHGTEFHVFLAAFQWLLHLYSSQKEVVVGVPFANRNLANSQMLMGVFTNALPIIGHVSADLTIADLVNGVKTESQQAFAHQNIPFSHIVQALEQRHFEQSNPLYQAMLSYQVFPFHDPEKLQYESLKVDYGVTKLDLNLWVEAEIDSIILTMYYNADLFNIDFIKKMMADFAQILNWMSQDSQAKLQDFSLLDRPQSQAFEQKALPKKASVKTVCQQFEDQVAKQPLAQAVRCEGRSMSYATLDIKASTLACWLKQQGVESGEIVALQLPKNEYYVVVILALWKANACYLPLDETLNDKQITPLLTQVGATLLIGDGPRLGAPINYLNHLDCPNDVTGCENYFWGDDPDLPAYILFTSGSSGTPKAVDVTHNQLAQYCEAMTPKLAQKNNAHYGMFSSFNTDLAHTMVFPALINGGCLEVISTTLLDDPNALCTYLTQYPLHCAKMTPSHLEVLLQLEEAKVILPRDLLVMGGEILTKQLVDKIREKSHCRILNHYGPTETTVGVACYEVPKALLEGSASVPIGYAFADSQLFILDEEQQILPVGRSGELYIASHHMANGYLHQEGLTQKMFIHHPMFSDHRLYRSGDRAMERPDGTIVFLGRMDRQVKIRGFRVELAEIEHRLSLICQQAVGVLHRPHPLKNGEGKAQLVAYIPCIDSVDQKAIKARLNTELPHFMKPDHIEWLKVLPLNHSGKVNYRQLSQQKLHIQQVINRPKSDTEQKLHQLFCDTLKESAVDIKANFFDMGGHSLNGLNLVININRNFGKDMSINDFYDNPSIEQLTLFIEQGAVSQPQVLVCLQAGQPEGYPTLLLIHPAGGNVVCYHDLANELGCDIPIYAIQVADFTRLDEKDKHISSLADKYLQDASGIINRENIILGGWSLGATIAFEMAIQLHDKTGSTPRLLILDQGAPKVRVENSSSMDDVHKLAHFASKVSRFMGKDLIITPEGLSSLDDGQRSRVFFDEFKRAGLVPQSVSEEDFAYFIRILQTHIDATEQYSGAMYAGEIIVVEAKTVLKGRITLSHKGLGWQAFTQQPLCHLWAKGDHLSILNPPYIGSLAQKLLQVLI